ncbi:MAG TPA: hypothetical protein VEI58_06450 [Chthoniobacterales bacterium]|nr:hypothetical protein [Chthoniobacterales bacterium]
MNRYFILLSFALLIFSSSIAQPSDSEQQLLALVKEVQTQQTQIADNQAKIDAKLVEVAEAVRLARIYSKRGK